MISQPPLKRKKTCCLHLYVKVVFQVFNTFQGPGPLPTPSSPLRRLITHCHKALFSSEGSGAPEAPQGQHPLVGCWIKSLGKSWGKKTTFSEKLVSQILEPFGRDVPLPIFPLMFGMQGKSSHWRKKQKSPTRQLDMSAASGFFDLNLNINTVLERNVLYFLT